MNDVSTETTMKKWNSVLDERTCDECRRRHGRVLTPDEATPPLHARFEHDGHPEECRCTLVPTRTLAVGERFNHWRQWEPRCVNRDSFELRRRMGFYNRGPRREMLNDLGVRWDDGINLLWPSCLVGAWDERKARQAARAMRPYVEEYDVVLLFGARVCRAFGVEFQVLQKQDVYVPLPHPSGQCRMWNEPELRERIRRYFA